MSISRTTLRDIREALARLDKDREAVSVQRTELDKQMTEIDRQADALRLSLDYLAQLHEEAQSDTAVPAKNLRNEMVQILREAAKPLHYTELRNQLESRDVQVNGVDKAKTVGAHLSNDTRFKKLGKGMWALASWPPSVAILDDEDDSESDPSTPAADDEPEWLRDQGNDGSEPPSQEPPKPQRPTDEETFAAEEFDDVPF